MKQTGNIFIAALWICTYLTGLPASAFDGVTNTIPDGTSYNELNIGENLPNTFLNIESNSTVSVAKFVRLGANDSSTNNTLLVEDGATLQIGTLTAPANDGIVVGDAVGDALIIKNASTVESSKLTMGAAENETAKIAIKGEGSSLVVNQDASIGALGDGNQVNVSGGAKFEVLGQLNVGSTNSSGNAISVDGTSTLAVGSLDNIAIAENNDIVINGTLQAKGDVSTRVIGQKNITMNSGSKVLVDDTLVGDIEDGYAIVLNDSAMWNTQNSDARIGFSTSGNSLSIINGSDITITNVLTAGEESNQNKLFVQDDAKLTAANINIGLSGSSNALTIEDNAELSMANGTLTAGGNGAASSNTINLKDEGSLAASGMTIGSGGKNNKFIQTGGTATITGDLTVGEKNGADGNSISISGDSTLSASNLIVGLGQNKGNTAKISGENATLTVDGMLRIGSDASSNNTVTVENGGTLFVGAQSNIVMGASSNNLLKVTTGTLKTTDWNFDLQTGSATNIVFGTDSTLHLLGILSGTNRVEGGKNFVLDGTNALWNTGTNALYVGSTSANNSLTLTNGASASTASNLQIGNLDTNKAWPNILSILEGSYLEVGGDAIVGYANTLKIDSTSQMHVGGNYEQGDFAILEIGISSNQVQPNLVVDKNAEFSRMMSTNYPIIKIFNQGVGESNIITIVKAGSITIDGETATSGDIRANIATNLLLGFDISVSNDLDNTYIVLDDFLVRTLGEAAGLSGQLLGVANEIESFTNQNATAMINILSGMDAASANKAMNDYYGEKMGSVPVHNAINMGLQSVSEQLTKRADNTRARMGAASATGTPDGAAGPHMGEQALQGWMTGYGTWADKEAADGFDGYSADIRGFLIGADFSVAEGILVGIAGGSGSSTLDKDNGASADTRTTFGSIYASAGTKDWFVDASLIYGGSSIDSTLGTAFDTTAGYDAQNVAVYLGGGKEIIGQYLIFTPQASLLGNYYKQDGYEEKSSNAVGRKVDSFDAFYLQSSVGCNVGFYTVMGDLVLKPEFRAFWLHEFNAQDESLPYSLIGGANSYALQLQAPEEDILKLGAGISTRLGEYLELRADLDSRMASGYSDYTLLGSLRYQF